MSNIHDTTLDHEVNVIVRAYGDEPVRIKGVLKGRLLEIYRAQPGDSMGWPTSEAFSDGPGIYEKLKAAWESGDRKAIMDAWGDAKPLSF